MSIIAGALAWTARFISGSQGYWVNSQPPEGQCIFVANHSSHLDFTVLWATLPRRVREHTRPVAAKDYWEQGSLRRYLALEVFRAVLVDRSGHNRHVLDPLFEALEQGHSLILFPEGTRGSGEEPGEFKSGIFHLVKHRPGLPVVPAHLENLNRVLPKGEFLPVPLLSRVHFGAPLVLQTGEGKVEFLERLRHSVTELAGL
jgi:1-acyl-sn-glycerol-3-phosphate acyltransferase